MLFNTLKNPRFKFVLLFIAAYIGLYSTNYILTGIIQPGGYYNEWLATHFDYIAAFRTFLLGATAKVVKLMNYDTYLTDNILYVKGGHNIRMVYSCMGVNILCLWWAFIITLAISIKEKAFYFFAGTFCLILLNIIRLSLLTISPKDISFGQLMIDHHDLYNWVVYGLIFLVMKQIIDREFDIDKTF